MQLWAVFLLTAERTLYMFRTHQWLLLQFSYSWWWAQKTSEICRV